MLSRWFYLTVFVLFSSNLTDILFVYFSCKRLHNSFKWQLHAQLFFASYFNARKSDNCHTANNYIVKSITFSTISSYPIDFSSFYFRWGPNGQQLIFRRWLLFGWSKRRRNRYMKLSVIIVSLYPDCCVSAWTIYFFQLTESTYMIWKLRSILMCNMMGPFVAKSQRLECTI